MSPDLPTILANADIDATQQSRHMYVRRLVAAVAVALTRCADFWHAAQQGLIAPNGTSIHAGIRTTLSGPEDYDVDAECGFHIVEAVEIDEIGTQGIIDRIKATVGDRPVYLSIDIDTLDPSAAPATGTPETGGWSTRELRRIVRGLKDLTIVGADIVEVAPAYDTQVRPARARAPRPDDSLTRLCTG